GWRRFLIEELNPHDENFYNYIFKIIWTDDPISTNNVGYYADINNEANGSETTGGNRYLAYHNSPTIANTTWSYELNSSRGKN
ncbi:MAG: hypothetical protein QF806_08750, partial [Pseudomonadales bacterium]|nr:hypothetical protein [Pseudomonadales bacterium]